MTAQQERKTKSRTVIREAKEADFPAISRIAHATWPSAYREMLSEAQISNMLATIYSMENLMAEAAAGHRFWIGHADTSPACYVSAYAKAGDAWIKKLYVHPEHQGSGMGAALISTVELGFPEARAIHLCVNPDNHAAKRFYSRNHFVCTGEQEVQMGDYHLVDLIFTKFIDR